MSKDKNAAPVKETAPDPETSKEVTVTAPTPEEIAAAAAKARADALFTLLANMDDSNDSQWQANGMPSMEYLSSVIGGEPVTMEEVGGVIDNPGDIQRRPVLNSPEDSNEDAPEGSTPSQRIAPMVKAGKAVSDKTVLTTEVVAAHRARQRVLEGNIADLQKGLREGTALLQAAQKERDNIVSALSTLDSNNHSETVKAYQASERRVNEQRAADVAAFRKQTGGVNIGIAATNADVNRLQRRSLRRRFGA